MASINSSKNKILNLAKNIDSVSKMTKIWIKNTFFVQIQRIRQLRIVKLTNLRIMMVISKLTHEDQEGNSVITPNSKVIPKGKGWRRCLGQDSYSHSCGWHRRNGSGSRDGVVGRHRGGSRSWDQSDLSLLTGDPNTVPQPDQRLAPAIALGG